jgi:hypothetical protein
LRNTSFADQTTKTSISHSILRIKTWNLYQSSQNSIAHLSITKLDFNFNQIQNPLKPWFTDFKQKHL